MNSTEIKKVLTRCYMKLYSAFHPIQKKVLFDSFGGKQYSDNPRAVSEKLHELYPDYQITWLLTADDQYNLVPDYVSIVRPGVALYREIATSCCFVTNAGITSGINKRENQLFIETWHGDRPLKKVLYAIQKPHKVDNDDYRVTDLCIAGSTAGVKQFREAFLYQGEVLCVGTPRNDRLVTCNTNQQNMLKQRLGLDAQCKVLLYAPTFRDNNRLNAKVMVNLKETIAELEGQGEKWVCLIRTHLSSSTMQYAYDKNKFLDVTSYPDMTDLLCITDILITDYSSCAGDLVVRNKMVILAIFDIDEYKSNCRDLVYDIDEIGFFVAHNQEELNSILRNRNDTDINISCRKVKEFFGIKESGKASEEICKRINDYYSRMTIRR